MSEHTPQHGEHASTTLEQKVTFFFVTVGVIALTFGALYIADFLPEKPDSETPESLAEEPSTETPVPEVTTQNVEANPTLIIFDSLEGREVAVFNPATSTVAAMDADLLKGAVRHPDSADFKNTGTIFILAHSSYLPNVMNKNFQAFNGIQKLKWGDAIRLRSQDTEYVYSVDRVYEVKASDAEVAIQHEEAKLTLATCNSFGTKDDRFIVEASLVSKRPLEEGKS